MAKGQEECSVLKLSLHGHLVGYLAGYTHGRNVLVFADEFRLNPERPTLSLVTHPDFPRATKLLNEPWQRNQRLPPTLSNLLPEGALRELISRELAVHRDNEFQIFSWLGRDLPGALIAEPVGPEQVPDYLLADKTAGRVSHVKPLQQGGKFSLAGVQMKLSMKEKEGRYNLVGGNELGDWIIKTPSTLHREVPLNEFTAMNLAALAGVEIPEIRLVERAQLGGLPPIHLPEENFVFAIKRFDRQSGDRVHMEDFAQVLMKYAHDKYNAANYEQIGKIIYQYSGDTLADIQQFARRLLVNILLANGDAHLKNWSLLYSDRVTARRSPAYDIVTTSVYVEGERQFALNLAKMKEWYAVSYGHFEAWSQHVGVPWRVILPHLKDVVDRARALWPQALNNLPMHEEHKKTLRKHWQMVQAEFRI